MRALYFILGILGIIASFIMFIIIISNKDLDSGTKVTLVFIDLIDFVSSTVFISISLLMEKSDEFETRIKRIEKCLLHTDEYEQLRRQAKEEKKKKKLEEKSAKKHEEQEKVSNIPSWLKRK